MPEYLAPGVYVEEVSFRPKSIEGVSTSTTGFVGPTRKGPLTETPEVITSFGEFSRIYGGLQNLSFTAANDANPNVVNYLAYAVRAYFDNGGSRLYVARTFMVRAGGDGHASSGLVAGNGGSPATEQARFRARMPGSGGNGWITAQEKVTPATQVTMDAAPVGSMLRTGVGTAAQPASLTGGVAPFTLTEGDQLTLTLSGGDQTITFNLETAAEAVSSDLGGPVDIPANATLVVTIDGGDTQTIDLTEGNATPLADLAAEINTAIRGGYARVDGNTLVIGSDSAGADAEVTIADNATLGFAGGTTVNGTGNVADLTAVTIDEIDALLQDAGGDVSATTGNGGELVLTTTQTGSAATLTASGTARAALGLPTTTSTGTDGTNFNYYVKNDSGGWADASSNPVPGPLPAGAAILSLNVEVVDGDGSSVLYEDLGFHSPHPRYIGAVLPENPSRRADALQNPYYLDAGDDVTGFTLQAGLAAAQTSGRINMSGGNDGIEPVNTAVNPGDVGYGDGLALLEDIEDISIVAAPGHSAFASYRDVQNSLLSHAERMRYRIAVLDTEDELLPGGARDARSRIDSKYGAMYYPWVTVSNVLARPGNEQIPREINLPPSGFIAGIYARNDNLRGVWKAPANEVVRGALRFESEINHRQQETLNPDGINVLRYFPGRGYLVWGARTVSSDPEWKYVNVRRYFIYLEHSIDRSTQWAVFEPNGPALWSNIRETVSAFLYNEWVSGALLGNKPEEAYFVRCDRSTMTQNDLDNGRLICEIGVAVLYPAEFVIFRIGQKTADARS